MTTCHQRTWSLVQILMLDHAREDYRVLALLGAFSVEVQKVEEETLFSWGVMAKGNYKSKTTLNMAALCIKCLPIGSPAKISSVSSGSLSPSELTAMILNW